MTTYTFLASSKEIQLPDETYNDARIFYEANESFGVQLLNDAEQWYLKFCAPL